MNIILGDKPARFTLELMSREWLSRSLLVFKTRTNVYLGIMLQFSIAGRGRIGSHAEEAQRVEDAHAMHMRRMLQKHTG